MAVWDKNPNLESVNLLDSSDDTNKVTSGNLVFLNNLLEETRLDCEEFSGIGLDKLVKKIVWIKEILFGRLSSNIVGSHLPNNMT